MKLDVNVVETAHVSLFGHGEGVASVKMSWLWQEPDHINPVMPRGGSRFYLVDDGGSTTEENTIISPF